MMHLIGGEALSRAIGETAGAFRLRAVRAAINRALGLDTVAQRAAIAMRATRRQRMNGAFKTVECPALALHGNLEGLVVIVTADVAEPPLQTPRFGARRGSRTE